MKDRFDLEEEIMKLYSFADDLQTVSELIMDNLELSSDTQDKSVNVLIGIETMLKIHADKMMDTMCQCFKLIPYDDNNRNKNFDPIYHGDMSYNPENTLKEDLTKADSGCRMKRRKQ